MYKQIKSIKIDVVCEKLRLFLEYVVKGTGYAVRDLSYTGRKCIINVKKEEKYK
ncbi:MAG: hypothetical protein HFG84_15540 [Dorea sp.]|nr:hypothetical protein [Dorea sp.]